MTKIKKMLGMMMAALLCFALTPAAAFASSGDLEQPETGEGSITIDNAIDGYAYTAYKVLTLVNYDKQKEAYTYQPASDTWAEFLSDSPYVTMERGYVEWVGDRDDSARVAEFAKSAVAFAKSNNISGKTEIAENGAVHFAALPLGWYVVDSSVGALCSLDTTATDVVIREKNDVPTINKQVEENGEWGTSSDASYGDTVNFKILVTAKAGAQDYRVHDILAAGLTLDPATIKVSEGEGEAAKAITEGATIITNPEQIEDGCTFEVALDDSLFSDLQRGTSEGTVQSREIVITYSAELNTQAAVGIAQQNKAKLTFGDSGDTSGNDPDAWSTTTTTTWGMNVTKVNGNNTEQKLAGAVFSLSKVTDEGNENVYVVPTNEAASNLESEEVATYRIVKEGESSGTFLITTNKSGQFTIAGIDSGNYQMEETMAPNGFNALTEPIDVEVVPNAENGIGYDSNVENFTGTILPSTGGMGTTILYVVGAVLVIGAVVFFVRRRSSSAK